MSCVASGSSFENAAAGIISACYSDTVEVSIGALHDVDRASASPIFKSNEHIMTLSLDCNCHSKAEH